MAVAREQLAARIGLKPAPPVYASALQPPAPRVGRLCCLEWYLLLLNARSDLPSFPLFKKRAFASPFAAGKEEEEKSETTPVRFELTPSKRNRLIGFGSVLICRRNHLAIAPWSIDTHEANILCGAPSCIPRSPFLENSYSDWFILYHCKRVYM